MKKQQDVFYLILKKSLTKLTFWLNLEKYGFSGFFLASCEPPPGEWANGYVYILDTQDTLNIFPCYGEIHDEL